MLRKVCCRSHPSPLSSHHLWGFVFVRVRVCCGRWSSPWLPWYAPCALRPLPVLLVSPLVAISTFVGPRLGCVGWLWGMPCLRSPTWSMPVFFPHSCVAHMPHAMSLLMVASLPFRRPSPWLPWYVGLESLMISCGSSFFQFGFVIAFLGATSNPCPTVCRRSCVVCARSPQAPPLPATLVVPTPPTLHTTLHRREPVADYALAVLCLSIATAAIRIPPSS